MTALLTLQVTSVRPVARHQADTVACLEAQTDCSDTYVHVNATTLYSPRFGRYLSLSREAMRRAQQGLPLRVSERAFS